MGRKRASPSPNPDLARPKISILGKTFPLADFESWSLEQWKRLFQLRKAAVNYNVLSFHDLMTMIVPTITTDDILSIARAGRAAGEVFFQRLQQKMEPAMMATLKRWPELEL